MAEIGDSNWDPHLQLARMRWQIWGFRLCDDHQIIRVVFDLRPASHISAFWSRFLAHHFKDLQLLQDLNKFKLKHTHTHIYIYIYHVCVCVYIIYIILYNHISYFYTVVYTMHPNDDDANDASCIQWHPSSIQWFKLWKSSPHRSPCSHACWSGVKRTSTESCSRGEDDCPAVHLSPSENQLNVGTFER